jgi:1,4-alpha-glucan branching enzyme
LKLEDLVIYEMHVGAFYDPRSDDGRPGTFHDAIKRLDHLAALGVNVVDVMPIHEFQGLHSWGYNPCDLFAVEQSYGGPDGLKAFVKACHRAGIAVHLDVVHNHYGPQNLDLLQFDGAGEPAKGGIYFYSEPGFDRTPWGPRPRFDSPQVRQFIRDNAILWLREYHVDGFRWDSTINIRAYHDGGSPIPAGLQMLEEINRGIRAEFPDAISIAEDSVDLGGFHGSWEYDFHRQVMPMLAARDPAERDVSVLAAALSSRPANMWRVVYVDNHDEAGKINGQFRIATDVDPRNPGSDYARRLCGLGALLTFTAPGIPLMLMGNEFQQGGVFHDDRPVDWGRATRHAGMFNLHRDLIRLRRNLDGISDALKGLEIRIPTMDRARYLLVYWRWKEASPQDPMVVALNLSPKGLTAMVPFPSSGPWKTVLNTEWGRYGGARHEARTPFSPGGPAHEEPVELAACGACIFALARESDASEAKAAAAALAAPADRSKPAFSLYASLHLVGSFNDFHLTACPMRLTSDSTWEGYVTLTDAPGIEFKLSANEDGRIFWGVDESPVIHAPYRGALRRLGANIRLEGPLNGTYRFTFDEESLELGVESVSAIPPEFAAGAPDQVFRTWTDVRGNKVEARLARIAAGTVTLERPAGPPVQVRIESLSPADQAVIQRFEAAR